MFTGVPCAFLLFLFIGYSTMAAYNTTIKQYSMANTEGKPLADSYTCGEKLQNVLYFWFCRPTPESEFNREFIPNVPVSYEINPYEDHEEDTME